MLITAPENLGDLRLSPDEALVKAREDTHEMLSAKGMFMPGQAELDDTDLSHGAPMHWREFLRRLQRCAPSLLIKEGTPGNIALYKLRRERDPDAYDPTRPAWWNDHEYVSGFPMAGLFEFSSIIPDERGRAKREIRGWRSVLIALIKSHAISYRDAVHEFGEPKGYRGWRWHTQLHNHKGA